MSKSCLIIVDVLGDFCKGGSLAVEGSEKIVPFINEIMLNGGYDFVVTIQESHPSNHMSFAATHGVENFTVVDGEMKWPVHCVVDTEGAEFHPDLDLEIIDANFIKGYKQDVDSYSGFGGILDADELDEMDETMTLHKWLMSKGVSSIDTVGLATDYCVKGTAIDGTKHGYDVAVLDEGTMAVSGDKSEAYAEMVESGVSIMYSVEEEVNEKEDTRLFPGLIQMLPFL